MLRQVNGEKVEMRLLYFMLNITRISSATGWRIFWVLGAALARPPQYPPPSLDGRAEAGPGEGADLGRPRGGAEAGTTGAEPR
jgi:hypothetical protein